MTPLAFTESVVEQAVLAELAAADGVVLGVRVRAEDKRMQNVIAVEVTDLRQVGGKRGFETTQDIAPVRTQRGNMRWLSGSYLDQPVEDDDPYRYFRW